MTDLPRAVLLLNNTMGMGGVETVVRTIAGMTSAWGMKVRVAVPDGAPVVDPGAPITHLPRGAGQSVLALRSVMSALPSGSIVHAHHRRLSLLANIALRMEGGGRPRHVLVEHVHNTFDDQGLLSFRAPVLVAAGSGIARMLTERYGRPQEAVHVLDNCADWVPRSQRRAMTGNALTVFGVGRLVREKEPDLWARVVTELHRRTRGAVTGRWLGDGPLMKFCAARHDVPYIRWAGNVPSVPAELRGRSDAVLLSVSTRDALPIAILEALAAGVPVVARDVGSISDAVISGRSGYLLPPGATSAQFVSAMLRCTSDATRHDLSSGARDRYEERFTPQRFESGLRSLYAAVRGRTPRTER